MSEEAGYRCVMMDPPWLERGGGKSKRGADRHYELMNRHDILRSIHRTPCWWDTEVNCHLWLWVTNNHLQEGIWLIDALGFRYVTNLVWVKLKDDRQALMTTGSTMMELVQANLQRGLGQYTYGTHELLLFSTRGATMKPKPKERVTTVIPAPRTEHSAKPIQAYTWIEQVSPGPRLEMFARQSRTGWHSVGLQLEPPDETEPS